MSFFFAAFQSLENLIHKFVNYADINLLFNKLYKQGKTIFFIYLKQFERKVKKPL